MHNSEKHEHESKHHDHDVAVSVITPSGVYPDDQDYHKAKSSDHIMMVLELAAKKLGLVNTSQWVAHSKGRDINPARTFHEEHLKEIVEIEWHLPEGGGGARGSR